MKLKDRLNLFSQKYKDRNVGTYAAAASFFLFLSLVPIAVLLFSLVPYTPLTQDGVIAFLEELLPSTINSFMVMIVAEVYGKQPALLSVSAILTLWSAGKGMQAITSGLNAINGYEYKRNFIAIRIEACVYTIILLILMIVTVIFFGFGNYILNRVLVGIIDPDSVIHSIFPYRYLFEWILYAALFTILYAWVPNRRTKPHKQLKGAVFAGVLWTAFSWGFSIYLQNYNPFSMYGSLATVIILLIWIYSLMILLMSGALINVYMQEDIPPVEPWELTGMQKIKKITERRKGRKK